MFLVEIEAGREELYETANALASAIRRGAVGPQSRIFHRASSSWVSIMVHPEYKKAVAELAPEPLPPLARNQWTFYGLEPRGREVHHEPAADTTLPTSQPAISEVPQAGAGWRSFLSRALRGLASPPAPSVKPGSYPDSHPPDCVATPPTP